MGDILETQIIDKKDKRKIIKDILSDDIVYKMFQEIRISRLKISKKLKIQTYLYKYKRGVGMLIIWHQRKMKISVIIPVYNCEDKIKRCVDSILAQGIKELEIILVNDGSIDNSAEVCNQIMKNEPRVKVIHQKNAGISEARNAGMKKAVGKYITFVDADDYLTKNPIYEKAINILEKENVEVVTWLWQYEQQGKYVVSKKKINNIPYGKISGKSFLDILYKGNYANGMVVGVWNKLYKRELVENEYFKYRYNEDDDWSIRVLSKVSGVYSLNEFGYVYTENVNSLTHQKFRGKNIICWIF